MGMFFATMCLARQLALFWIVANQSEKKLFLPPSESKKIIIHFISKPKIKEICNILFTI
jgi:hypothetical protein